MEDTKVKDKLFKILYYLLYYVAFGYIGIRCVQIESGEAESFPIGVIILAIICMVINFIIHIILHEAGHMVAGLLTGYKFVSFRIGSFVWIKNTHQKIELKRMKIQGTGGQCLMCPPDLEIEKCPYKMYHLMGGVTNLSLGMIALIVVMLLPHNLISFCLVEEFGVVGILLGLTNLIPCKTNGIQNDGYNVIDVTKDIMAKKCLNLVLSMNALLTVADSYDDLPEDIVNTLKSMDFTKMDISNSSIANAFVYQTVLYFIDDNYDKCYELQKYIAESTEVLPIFRNEAKCECLFYELINGESKEIIEKRYDKELQKYIKATMMYPSRQRLMYTYYKLYEKNNDKAEKCMRELEKMIDTFSIKADAKHELEVAKRL